MQYPRIMFAAPSSGSGKTLITCGILQLLVNRGIKTTSFKCGPDYIDPMFHSRVIGADSRNLDTYFAQPDTVRYMFAKTAAKAEISVLEGVMGFYDGVAGISTQASSYDLAKTVKAPVVLIVNSKGMSLSILPLIQGFVNFCEDAPIQGVILNQMPKSMYPEIKEQIESKLHISVYGYVPKVEDCVIESRHLGLVTPNEIAGLKEKLNRLADVLEETLDVEGLLKLANEAEAFDPADEICPANIRACLEKKCEGHPRIGVAKDEAFCFYYKDNLEWLEELGAELCYFSPLHDQQLPEKLHGLLFGGGYPELYAQTLSENEPMRQAIKSVVDEGIPYLAECGGFMYLHEQMEDMEHRSWAMVGVIHGNVVRTKSLGRFGYIQLEAKKDQMLAQVGECIKAHEFHYFDSSSNGADFHATKPLRKRNWDCIHGDERSAAGFPHLYYYSNPEFAARFVSCCAEYGNL